MRLLVVEDQKDLNEIIVRKLTNEHYTVDACYSGDEALDFIRCAEYDGIILDIMLPGITGIGVLKEMRAAGNKTPVLLLTALGTVEDRVAGLDAGADDIVFEEDVCVVYSLPTDFTAVRDALAEKGLTIMSAEIEMIPQNTVDLDEATIPRVQKIIDMFEDNDDVQNVYHNAVLPEEEDEE